MLVTTSFRCVLSPHIIRYAPCRPLQRYVIRQNIRQTTRVGELLLTAHAQCSCRCAMLRTSRSGMVVQVYQAVRITIWRLYVLSYRRLCIDDGIDGREHLQRVFTCDSNGSGERDATSRRADRTSSRARDGGSAQPGASRNTPARNGIRACDSERKFAARTCRRTSHRGAIRSGDVGTSRARAFAAATASASLGHCRAVAVSAITARFACTRVTWTIHIRATAPAPAAR